MIDGLKTMYDDFYGVPKEDGGDKAKLPGKGAGKEGAGTGGKGGDAAPDLDAKKAPGVQEIETEVLTEGDLKAQATAQAEEPVEPKEPEKSGMEELNELIGLKSVKHDVEELIGLAKVRKMREEKEMKAVPVSLHLVFSGNPGTGKTTVARILAKLYKEIGILSTGQLVETDRSGLVAGYVGQTAIKTQKKIEEAMGGVLFIDEAYTLNQEGENFGQESIDTILKAMEDHRDKFIVIVAGYTDLMREFIESNPGLRSRFNKYFEFPDYTADELQQIFMMQCNKYQYKLTEEAEKAARDKIAEMEAEKDENFANARAVRNLFEKIITNQASRVADLEDVDDDTLVTITMDDMQDLDEEGSLSGSKETVSFDMAGDDAATPQDGEVRDPVEELIKILEKNGAGSSDGQSASEEAADADEADASAACEAETAAADEAETAVADEAETAAADDPE